jgi:hypothetical protein
MAATARHRIVPGFSVGKMLVFLGYVGILTYALLLDSNPLMDYGRGGFVAVSQIPVVFVLAAKNNLAGMLLGKGYEKVIFAFSKNYTPLM